MGKSKNKINDVKILQRDLETKLRRELLSNPTEETFRNAYDELHAFFLKKARQEEIYSSGIKWFSNIFLRKIGSGKKVLDIGTGNGKLAFALAQNKNEVIGIDISTIALETANSKLQNLSGYHSLPISFQYGDARHLNFPDQSFDFVVSHDLIEHLTENDFLLHLNEVERVLKIGGTYLFWTPSRLRGGSSLGLHLKEYTIEEMVGILKNKILKYNWIDARFFKLRLILEFPQNLLSVIIWYEKIVRLFINYIPNPIKKIFVPPLFFGLTKIERV
jgi:ubiquinone/menaquinone biosynthesis C-methylase UbiE